MKLTRLRLLLIAAIVVAGGLLATTLANNGTSAAATDPHGKPNVSPATMARVLNATAAASTAPQAELIANGRTLFRSSSVAKSGESCQSCHSEGTANAGLGTTPHPVAGNVGDFTGPRDPPNLVNVARTSPYFWTGTETTLTQTVIDTILNHFTDGKTQPAAKTGQQAAAMVAYVKQLRSPRTSFDDGTMSLAAERGLRLFQTKGGCIACHGGPDFTDNRFHATCVSQMPGANDPGATVPGMFDCTTIGAPPGLGAFNTPQLRDVVDSAPYMHNGRLTTLTDVVNFYNSSSSISPLRLTPAEVKDLVAFLSSL
ncbi:MAG: cytochrome c peroxidase [Solirubrobacteraceae bacterium]|jgi:cytochrome c peroxidase|nr:cytochrome c peroxidase [Solirubrobacteraceae bacterium]